MLELYKRNGSKMHWCDLGKASIMHFSTIEHKLLAGTSCSFMVGEGGSDRILSITAQVMPSIIGRLTEMAYFR